MLKNDELTVGSGTNMLELINWCEQRGVSGFEELYGIPATVGGMIMMNAGAFNKQIFDNLVEIEVLKNVRIKTIKKEEIKFFHHETSLLKTNLIILKAKFKI